MSNDEYDSPWKEAIETYFQECIEFFFPVAAEGIDWKRGYTFLDKELQQVIALELKFGSKGLTLLPEIVQIQNVEILRAILTSIKTVSILKELRQIYQ
ncbi:hypothetical protein [uncultured Nostoc sp.]|uniref:hypothetical protein n=1 Tax=uncultured Nostoc sp. TaxID=340711 RepID=UPI0035CBD4D7